MAQGLRIGEILERTGVTRATVHHYVKEGLLPSPKKTGRSTALYDPGCVERILLIRGLQKQYRRSLSEVKGLLSSRDSAGVARLLERVERSPVEYGLEVGLEGQDGALSLRELCEKTGFREEQVGAIAELGLIRGREVSGVYRYPAADVQVALCLSRLDAAGLDRRHGFEFSDAVIYVDALRKLLQREVELFLVKGNQADPEADLLALAATTIEEITPLVVALRRKLLREVLESN